MPFPSSCKNAVDPLAGHLQYFDAEFLGQSEEVPKLIWVGGSAGGAFPSI
jgi:hypothetical protein